MAKAAVREALVALLQDLPLDHRLAVKGSLAAAAELEAGETAAQHSKTVVVVAVLHQENLLEVEEEPRKAVEEEDRGDSAAVPNGDWEVVLQTDPRPGVAVMQARPRAVHWRVQSLSLRKTEKTGRRRFGE